VITAISVVGSTPWKYELQRMVTRAASIITAVGSLLWGLEADLYAWRRQSNGNMLGPAKRTIAGLSWTRTRIKAGNAKRQAWNLHFKSSAGTLLVIRAITISKLSVAIKHYAESCMFVLIIFVRSSSSIPSFSSLF
jgi:hypothetical protein